MLFFEFIQLLSAIVVQRFVIRIFFNEGIISKNAMTKIGTIYLFWVFVLLVVFRFHGLSLTSLLFAPLLLSFVGAKSICAARKRNFENSILRVLNQTILQMKIGIGFRSAFIQALDFESPNIKTKMNQVIESVIYADIEKLQCGDEKTKKFVEFLKKVDDEPQNSLNRLQNYRNFVKKKFDFRHRSGQILRQIYFQAVIVVAIYFALLIFVGRFYGLLENIKIVTGSNLLFLVGTYFLIIGGTKKKWKI